MDKQKKAEWVANLRSGEYKQTEGALRNTDLEGNHSYCCLGVLTDMYCKATGIEWDGRNAVHKQNAVLPFQVAKWAGMDTSVVGVEVGEYGPDGCYLTNHNDSGMTFPEIADIIEENF